MKVTPVSFISWVTFHNEPPQPLIQFPRAQPLQHRLQQTGPVPRGHFEGQPPQSGQKVGKYGKSWAKYGKSWKNHGRSWKSWKAGNRIQEIYRKSHLHKGLWLSITVTINNNWHGKHNTLEAWFLSRFTGVVESGRRTMLPWGTKISNNRPKRMTLSLGDTNCWMVQLLDIVLSSGSQSNLFQDSKLRAQPIENLHKMLISHTCSKNTCWEGTKFGPRFLGSGPRVLIIHITLCFRFASGSSITSLFDVIFRHGGWRWWRRGKFRDVLAPAEGHCVFKTPIINHRSRSFL